jgi:hypothetical protein
MPVGRPRDDRNSLKRGKETGQEDGARRRDKKTGQGDGAGRRGGNTGGTDDEGAAVDWDGDTVLPWFRAIRSAPP